MAAKIKNELQLDTHLNPGAGGEFEVVVNGALVYSKRQTQTFPVEDEMVTLIRELY